MQAMSWIVVVTAVALLQYMFFGYQVGVMRGKHGVSAPETVGDPEFMRMFRIHQNTMEQLVIFIPALWIFAHYFDPKWGAGIGLVYIASRFVYYIGYLKNPKSRGRGFGIGFAAQATLVIGSLVGAVKDLI